MPLTLDDYIKLSENNEVEVSEPLFKEDGLKVSDVDDEERTVTAVISTDSVDRDKEILLPKGARIDRFLANPVVLWSHSSGQPPIGRALWVNKGRNKLIAKIKFAVTERAEEVWQLFKGRFLNAFSVGFLPFKGHVPTPDEIKKKPDWAEAKYVFDDWELLEFSPVNVPSNPDALAYAIKTKAITLSPETMKELNIVEEETNEIFLTDKTSSQAEIVIVNAIDTNITFGDVEKPYPNEHACRLHPPGNYDRFARKNCEIKHDGKCIDVIYGIKSGKSEIQAYRYPKDVWQAAAAKSHCSSHGGSFDAAKTIVQVEPVYEVENAEPNDLQINVQNMSELIVEELRRKQGRVFCT